MLDSSTTVGDVINLNRYRKRMQQKAASEQADANAVRSGRTKAERTRVRAETRRRDEELAGHRREPSADVEEPDDE